LVSKPILLDKHEKYNENIENDEKNNYKKQLISELNEKD